MSSIDFLSKFLSQSATGFVQVPGPRVLGSPEPWPSTSFSQLISGHQLSGQPCILFVWSNIVRQGLIAPALLTLIISFAEVSDLCQSFNLYTCTVQYTVLYTVLYTCTVQVLQPTRPQGLCSWESVLCWYLMLALLLPWKIRLVTQDSEKCIYNDQFRSLCHLF